jgi:uncharacterized OB-fold protein
VTQPPASAVDWAPANPLVGSDAAGRPFLQGWRCDRCDAAVSEPRIACPGCGAGRLAPFETTGEGAIKSYTVVYRSYPGIKVPFVSTIVRLDDGFSIKANLEGVPAEPSDALFGKRVRVAFDLLESQKDPAGKPYLAYHVEPVEGAS